MLWSNLYYSQAPAFPTRKRHRSNLTICIISHSFLIHKAPKTKKKVQFPSRTSYFYFRVSYFYFLTSYFYTRTSYFYFCSSYFCFWASYFYFWVSYFYFCSSYFYFYNSSGKLYYLSIINL